RAELTDLFVEPLFTQDPVDTALCPEVGAEPAELRDVAACLAHQLGETLRSHDDNPHHEEDHQLGDIETEHASYASFCGALDPARAGLGASCPQAAPTSPPPE